MSKSSYAWIIDRGYKFPNVSSVTTESVNDDKYDTDMFCSDSVRKGPDILFKESNRNNRSNGDSYTMTAPKPALKSKLIQSAGVGIASTALAIFFRHVSLPDYLSWLHDTVITEGLTTISGLAFAFVIHRRLGDLRSAKADMAALEKIL